MTNPRPPGPDFIIIGAMKCATSTLEAQLKRQDGIFMTEPKEPNYFGSDENYARGPAWYGALYAGAGAHDLRGEASTDYTKWPTYPAAPERMARDFPDLKLIYLMKHPVKRLVSHYMHEWTMGHISDSLEAAVDRYPEFSQYSLYATQLKPYLETFGPDRILPVYAERLRLQPLSTLAGVCEHIGHTGAPVWHDHVGEINVSSRRLRTGRWGRYVIDNALLTRLRRSLLPETAREAIKSRFRMNEAPALGIAAQHRLEAIFDDDLQRLPLALPERLTCANFDTLTAKHVGRWAP